MANHKSLTIALFASAAIMGLAGCSDDSSGNIDSNELLTLGKYETQLTKNSQESIQATHSAAAVTAKSADESCVTVSVVKDANEANVSSVVLQAVGAQACDAIITVKGDKAEKEIKAHLVYGVSVLTVAPESVAIDTTATKRVTATFKKDGEALADSVLNVSVADPACASVAADSVTVNAKGEAYIDITAGKDSCETKLTVTSKDESDKTKTVSIKVLGEDESVIVEGGKLEFVTLKPAAGPVSITLSDGKKQEFQVRYSDKNGTGIESALISFEDIDNDDCFGLSASKTLRTKEDGTVKQGVTVKSKAIDGCSGKLSITTSDASIEPLVANITVAPTKYYDMTITMTAETEKIENKVRYAHAGLFDGISCDQALAMRDQWVTQVGNAEYHTDEASITPGAKPFATFEEMIVEVAAGKVAVVGYGTAGDESTDILAYGCTEINRMEGAVNIELKEVPVEIKGTYDIVSNFDISSAFTKDKHPTLPAVEEMNAGDWIDWVVDLFDDPVKALFDFIWVNSIARLAGYVSNIPYVGNTISALLSNDGKQLVYGMLKPEIDTYLDQFAWYKTILAIAPDINDLITNMQFKGTMTVTEVAADGVTITAANQQYNQLQYRWSYKADENTKCMKGDVFTESGTCRMSLMLDKSQDTLATMSGDWEGKVYTGNDSNSLNIDQHEMQFKWATILYIAVFGDILPSILGYNTNNLANGRYVTAFLEKILFKSIVNYYNSGIADYNQTNGCTCSVTGTTEKCTSSSGKSCRYTIKEETPCTQFIEALVYYMGLSESWHGAIPTVAAYACGTDALGRLDTLVPQQLDKVQAGTFKIKSNSDYSCMLYEDSTTSYQRIGNIEMETARGKNYSITDMENKKLSTNRCHWKFAITDNYSMDGLFHAVRNTK